MIIRGGTFGPVATNTYVVADDRGGSAWVVDPAMGSGAWVDQTLERLEVTPVAVLDTHGHWDHVVENHVWAARGLEPMVLFLQLAALAAVGIMTLMAVCCLAALGFYRKGGGGNENGWTRIGAPLMGAGAMAVIRYVQKHGTAKRPWLARLIDRKPTKVAAVALANKTARIAWVIMARGERYRAPTMLAA